MQEMGFEPLIGGGRFSDGKFNSPGESTWWWSVTLDDNRTNALVLGWNTYFNPAAIFLTYLPNNSGFYVRCLKD
jgi:hypothetical protein